jgi:O-antigen ligase
MVVERPWWGHGFGAVWMLDSFRESIRQLVGWPSQPLIADNGFLDVLLHLGIVGLVLLVAILATAFVQSFRYAIDRRNLAGFFPLLFLCYVGIANISFSMIAETEVFVWLLMVSVSFMTSSLSGFRNKDEPLPASASNPG